MRLELEQLGDRICPSALPGNLAPSIESLAFDLAAPKTKDVLTVEIQGANDPDADPITFQYEWFVNGLSVQIMNTSQLTDSLDLSQPGFGDKGDTVSVSVTPMDLWGSGTPVSVSTAVAALDAQITFLNWELSPNNSDANLFTSDEEPITLPLIQLSAQVQGSAYSEQTPTGNVYFIAVLEGGERIPLGYASIGPNGKATIEVDSGLIDQPALIVEAEYAGDEFYATRVVIDQGFYCSAMAADPPVNDNPVITPTSTNLTVIVMSGSVPERVATLQTLRGHNPNAFIITTVHTREQLAQAIAALPAGSISSLIIMGHGDHRGIQLGRAGDASTRFNNANLSAENTVRGRIAAALAPDAWITLHGCNTAADPSGLANIQGLANLFNRTVWGSTRTVSTVLYTDPALWTELDPE